MADPRDVVIVGGGIIGLASAQKLQAAGRRVTLIERAGLARGASFGNAGAFAFSDILPLAASGKLARVPRWLRDPLGPLSIPPAYFPTILPWLLRFWRAGWPDRIARSTAAQTALMRLAATEMQAMTAAAGLSGMVRSDGSLELYESERERAAAAAGWQARERAGISFEHVRGEDLAALQPGLSPRFPVGTFVPAWQTVEDPYLFAQRLADYVIAEGAEILAAEVASVLPDADGVSLRLDDGATLTARARRHRRRRLLPPPRAAARRPHPPRHRARLQHHPPPGAFDLKRQLIFGGHGFVVTPLATGIRIGGAVELGGLALPPNYKRSDAMLQKAATFLPGLRTEGGTRWMGFRPSLPDSLPAIGPSRTSSRIIHAFGHGHLGLTQSAATGRLVADLVCDRPPAIDISPFSPQRF